MMIWQYCTFFGTDFFLFCFWLHQKGGPSR